jgi:hypothetical protein
MPAIRCLATLLVLVSLGCATAPAPPPQQPDRYSPERMRSGPSLQETGRFGVTPISSNGLRIEDARAEEAPPPPPPAPTAPPARRSHKHRTTARQR